MVGRSRPLPLHSTDRTGQAPLRPYNPDAEASVWAPPVSLAATQGISFDFFSWGYLDVSVLPVGSPCGVTAHDRCRVAPFGNPGITACVRLPRDYRGLPRPSSPVRAKASTVRPYFAWPDFLRPHSKARLFSSQRTDAHVGNTLGAYLSYYPSPYPCFQSNQVLRSALHSASDPRRSASRSFRVPRDLTRSSKGGDPAAGSPTATLLRLRPSHRARLRRLPPASGLGQRLRALPTSMA